MLRGGVKRGGLGITCAGDKTYRAQHKDMRCPNMTRMCFCGLSEDDEDLLWEKGERGTRKWDKEKGSWVVLYTLNICGINSLCRSVQSTQNTTISQLVSFCGVLTYLNLGAPDGVFEKCKGGFILYLQLQFINMFLLCIFRFLCVIWSCFFKQSYVKVRLFYTYTKCNMLILLISLHSLESGGLLSLCY